MAFRKSATPQNGKQNVDMLQLQNYSNSREEHKAKRGYVATTKLKQ